MTEVSKLMKTNADGTETQVYPETHLDAVVGLDEYLATHGGSGGTGAKGDKGDKGELVGSFAVENLVKNGNFSAGVTGGWAAYNATHSAAVNVLTNIADGSASYGIEMQSLKDLIVNDKYYISAKISVNSAVCESIRARFVYSKESYIMITSPVQNKKYQFSAITTPTQTVSDLSFGHFYASSADAKDANMTLENVVVIDLTKTFGAGQEPSQTDMDKMMDYFTDHYFDGSSTLAKSSTSNNGGGNSSGDGDQQPRQVTFIGATNQIEITADATTGANKIEIPKNPMLMQPEYTQVQYGAELSPVITAWTGINGSTLDSGAWTIPAKGAIKATLSGIEAAAVYEIGITWAKTNDYSAIETPQLVASLGTVKTVGQFTGYSDALYKLTITAAESGSVDLQLGDGVEEWTATITGISVKKVTQLVTPAGKLGLGKMDVTTSGDNFAIGDGQQKRTSGTGNNSIGLGSLTNVTVGRYNTAFGTYALQSLDTGLNNIAIGYGPLRYLKSGYYNIAIGYSAMEQNINGHWNVAIGNESMRDLTSGIRNTVVGSRAMNSLTTGNQNVAVGREAGLYPNAVSLPTVTGSNNVFIGFRSGQTSSTQPDGAVAIGANATTTTNATAIGIGVSAQGTGSVAIGVDSDGTSAAATDQNEVVIGTIKHNVKVPGKLNIAQYTPVSTADTQGSVGDFTSDSNYIYVKTTSGWKRSALETF